MTLRHRLPRAAALTAVATLAVAGVLVPLASASSTSATTVYYGCVKTSGTPDRVLFNVYLTAGHACPSGSFGIHWSQTGPQGPQGPAGPQGPQGPPGPATLSVTASTAVSAWPESSGWANDNFTRTVTVTRQHAVPASDCGATATSCWFYTETLADSGSFTTVDGHASPNGSSSATITGAWTGTMSGGGKLEFYASSDTPDPSLVPGTANGSAKPSSTTDWYQLFFPAGTLFGLTAGANAPWITYDWVYAVTVPCGSSSSVSENWNDGINPGDDGQGASDGDITGTSACTA